MDKKEYMRLWRKKNQDKVRAYHREYKRKFYERDREKIMIALKKWRTKNRLKVLKYNKKYKLEHPEKLAKWRNKRIELLKIKRLEDKQKIPLNIRMRNSRLNQNSKFFNTRKEDIERELEETNRRLENYKNRKLTFEELMDIVLFKKE